MTRDEILEERIKTLTMVYYWDRVQVIGARELIEFRYEEKEEYSEGSYLGIEIKYRNGSCCDLGGYWKSDINTDDNLPASYSELLEIAYDRLRVMFARRIIELQNTLRNIETE